jgi:hypothetical protein
MYPDHTTLKRCTKCGEEKPDTLEFFPKKRGKTAAQCKACAYARSAEWARNNPEKAREKERRYRDAHRDERNQKTRERRAANRDEFNSRVRARYWENVEHNRQMQRDWRRNNPDKQSQYDRTWRLKNMDAQAQMCANWRAANPDYRSKWKKANPDRLKTYDSRRRSKKSQSTEQHKPGELAAIRAAQTDKKGRLICWKCGKPIIDTPHLDHWIPLDKDGSNGSGNLHFMHAKCNLEKGAKMPAEIGRLI